MPQKIVTSILIAMLLLMTRSAVVSGQEQVISYCLVAETLNAGGYTYIRCKELGNDLWLATMSTSLTKGEQITFFDTPPIMNFNSKELKRTFPQVMFVPGLGRNGSRPAIKTESEPKESFQPNADIYQYEDENGTVIMTDRPENVPAKKLKKSRKKTAEKTIPVVNGPERIESNNTTSPLSSEKCDPSEGVFRLCKEYLNKSPGELPNSIGKNEYVLLINAICSDPSINDRLTEQEKWKVRDNSKKTNYAKANVPSDKQYEINLLPKMLSAACDDGEQRKESKEYSRKELDDLGRTFTRYFKELGSALAAKDFKKAAGFYHDLVKDSWLSSYASLPKVELKKIAQDMQYNQVYVERIEDDYQAVCQLLTNVDGERYSFHLVFQRDSSNNWKILSM